MENGSCSRSRSLERQRGSNSGKQRGSSLERHRVPSSERQRTPSAERRHGSSLEKQRASLYTTGLVASPKNSCNNNPDYLPHSFSGENDLSLSHGQESSRRYAEFLRQDGLLHADINATYNVEKSNSQTSVCLDSPNDQIAPERLGQQKRRPSSTPAASFYLPSSKSHPGPGIACNFNMDVTTEPSTPRGKASSTSVDNEDVTVFQNGLNDVTQQLELIQETQGTILTELASDIEALQAENTYLRESRIRLQCANDNLLKVVQDLTQEIAQKKNLDPHLSSSSKDIRTKTPKEMLKGIETILTASRTALDIKEKTSSRKGCNEDKTGIPIRSSNSKLKSRHSNSTSTGKKSAHSKTSYSRGDVPRPKSKTRQGWETPGTTSKREREEQKLERRPSVIRNDTLSYDDDEIQPHVSTSRRHQNRMEPHQDDDDSYSDDRDYSQRSDKKKKKSGCFSCGRKRKSDRRRNNRD